MGVPLSILSYSASFSSGSPDIFPKAETILSNEKIDFGWGMESTTAPAEFVGEVNVGSALPEFFSDCPRKLRLNFKFKSLLEMLRNASC